MIMGVYKRRFTDRHGVSKTQKHIARDVPDRVVFAGSRDDSDLELKLRAFTDRWTSLMQIKHADFDHTKVIRTSWFSYDTNKILVEHKYNHYLEERSWASPDTN